MKIKNHVLPSQVTYIVLFLVGGRKERGKADFSVFVDKNK